MKSVDQEIISRADAKARGLQFYFTGRPCLHGHVVGRRASNKACVECNKAHGLEWRRVNFEKRQAYDRAWKAANPAHRAAILGRTGALFRVPNCVPPDADLEVTIPFYAEAQRLTNETGILHEVDHIVALVLGGKHEAANLQVITKRENITKGLAERALHRVSQRGERHDDSTGEMLARTRERAGLTQAELATRVCTTQSVICRLESLAYTSHTIRMVSRMLEAMGYELRLEAVKREGTP